MARSPWRNIRTQVVEGVHVTEVAGGVLFRQLHRFELFKHGLLLELVFALVGVVGEVPDIGDVLNVPHAVTPAAQPADKHIEADVALPVTQMAVAVDGWTADVNTHEGRVQGFEILFRPGDGVVQFHCAPIPS